MPRIAYLDGNEPNNPLRNSEYAQPQATLPGFNHKRGKIMPTPRATWGMKDANGRDLDPDASTAILNEALGN